jgi:hypothetical protein
MQKRIRGLLIPALAALGVAVITPLAPGASTVQFNPTGGGFGGGQAGNIFNVSSFSYDNGNALSIGGNQAVANAILGTGPTTTQVVFQSTLGTVNGAASNGNVISINSNLIALPPTAASGDISINNNLGTQISNLSKEIVLAGTFTEQVTPGSVTSGGGNNSVQFSDASAPVLSATNSITLYIQASGTSNELSGTGFSGTAGGAIAILTGHLIPAGFGSTFTSNFSEPTTGTGSQSSPVKLDQYSYSTGGTSNYPTTQSVSGTGSTNFQIAVDSFNSSYFSAAPTIIGLSFNPISTSLPFGQEPPAASVQGNTPNIGTVDGGNLLAGNPINGGPDFLFQTQATNNFAVPEPSSISMALTGIGLVSLARVWARRRRVKTSTV